MSHVDSRLLSGSTCAVQSCTRFSACGCVQQPRRQQQLYERRCKSRVSTARTTTAHSQGSSRRGCSTHTIISQNCRGLKSHTRIAELVDVLRRREAFAACVQETWRAGDEQLLEGDACFIGVGPPAQQGRGSQGVGLVLSRLAVAAWREAGSDIWRHGSRVIGVPLLVTDSSSGQKLGIALISAYAPVSTASQEEWDTYYDNLNACIACAPKGSVVLVGTDANASVGRGSLGDRCNSNERVGAIGPFGLDHINSSGRRLRSYMETRELASAASFYKKKHYGTWIHPRSKLVHQLDHFMISRRDLRCLADAGSFGGQLIDSDHRGIMCKLRIAVKLRRKQTGPRSMLARLDRSSLQQRDAQVRFSKCVLEKLRVLLQSTRDDTSIDTSKASLPSVSPSLHACMQPPSPASSSPPTSTLSSPLHPASSSPPPLDCARDRSSDHP